MVTNNLNVVSHVGRDLIASAGAFKTEASAIWEYVVNSLQYVDKGAAPRVQVAVNPRKHEIVISDNGRGMSSRDLKHFFTMHAENLDRLSGRPGRGKFGTGKSAAFGIANSLTVDTVQHGKRNIVKLSREMIDASTGENIPTDWQVVDEATDNPNGTRILIEDVLLPRIRTAPVIDYIERHLQAFRAASPQVAVNSHVCEYREPEVAAIHDFEPNESQRALMGNTVLTIKVARAPLPDNEQGVSITSGAGNLVATETCGIEAKEFGSYLFGEIDVPAIELHETPIQPYDASRSLQLNPHHPVAAVVIGFVGSKLEKVRKELVQQAKEARKTEQMRRLATEADKIAQILNDDFSRVKDRLQDIRSASSRSGAAAASFGDTTKSADQSDEWVRGTTIPGDVNVSSSSSSEGKHEGREAPDITPAGQPNPEGDSALDPAGGKGSGRSRARGGFRVEYSNLGPNHDRSKYESNTLKILINLDHPVVKAALGDGVVEEPAFRRLSYEIAFSEYAMGLGYEIFRQDVNIPADDLLYEVRSSLNRVAGAAAQLYV